MRFVSKFFEELTITELYEILKAREAVFLLEQRCICQDLDDMDYRSLHIFLRKTARWRRICGHISGKTAWPIWEGY